MVRCPVCEADDTEPCPYCDRPVCETHRRPSRHACTGPPTAPGSPHGGADADRGRDPIRDGIALVLATLLVAIAVLVAASFAPVGGTPPDSGPDETRIETAVHEFVNDERRARGLAPLTQNATLARMARDHSERMARESTFGHGEEPLAARYDRYGLDCPGGENIYAIAAVGAPYDERALARRTVDAWLGSAGHSENLLRERFRAHGIGVATARAPGRTTVYVTQDLC